MKNAEHRVDDTFIGMNLGRHELSIGNAITENLSIAHEFPSVYWHDACV